MAIERVIDTGLDDDSNEQLIEITLRPQRFDEYIGQVDVVMLLRMQFERHKEKFDLTYDDYLDKYGLNQKRYDMMKDKAIILHPAPFNRGLEIADEVVEAPKSKIFTQMTNGLYLRMAVLYNELK